MLDLILREGWLIDPERLTMLPGSLGVKDGKIAGIYPMGAALPETAEVVDLHGDAVSPGFIDVHAHLDGHVECGRRSLLQGITTSFGGNCGLSPVDIGAFYASQKDGFCVHQAEFVGPSFSLREAVGLTDTRQSARPDQIAQMEALARRAMDDGAWGVSFGLDYCPGCSFREVEALGRLTAEYGGVCPIHTRLFTMYDMYSISEAALLAGIIKAPSNYAPHVNLEKSVQRRDYVLRSMADCGYITDSQADRAARETVQLAANIDDGGSGWFMDAALEEAAEALSLTMDELLSGGYRIETQYDSEFQRAADALFDDPDRFPDSAADGTPVQAALVAMDPSSGAVRALVGGRSYDVRLGLNRATGIRRSPGSAIKPVSTYAAAIDRYGLSPTSMVEDTPRDFGNGYSPGNAGGNTYGTVTLREALSRSLNVATVDLADLVGVSAVRGYAERFGLTLSPRDASLSLALGSMTDGVSPAELCAAYAALANGGTRVKAHLVSRIVDAEGAAVYEFKAPDSRAVRDSTAYMLTDMLETAASQGSARAMASVWRERIMSSVPAITSAGMVSAARSARFSRGCVAIRLSSSHFRRARRLKIAGIPSASHSSHTGRSTPGFMPHGFRLPPLRISFLTCSGRRSAKAIATFAPSLKPSRCARAIPRSSMKSARSSAKPSMESAPPPRGDLPWPRESTASTRKYFSRNEI